MKTGPSWKRALDWLSILVVVMAFVIGNVLLFRWKPEWTATGWAVVTVATAGIWLIYRTAEEEIFE